MLNFEVLWQYLPDRIFGADTRSMARWVVLLSVICGVGAIGVTGSGAMSDDRVMSGNDSGSLFVIEQTSLVGSSPSANVVEAATRITCAGVQSPQYGGISSTVLPPNPHNLEAVTLSDWFLSPGVGFVPPWVDAPNFNYDICSYPSQ
jgi:hypothetical protein